MTETVKYSRRTLLLTQSGPLLLEVLLQSKNIDVLTPQEKSFLNSLQVKLKELGKNFEWSQPVINRLRNIVMIVCWDLV